jgi:hypothetical protein
MRFSFSGPVSAVSGKKEKSLLGLENLIQVGSSLSADGVQPELQPLLYQNAPSVVVNSQTTDGFAVALSATLTQSDYGRFARHTSIDYSL